MEYSGLLSYNGTTALNSSISSPSNATGQGEPDHRGFDVDPDPLMFLDFSNSSGLMEPNSTRLPATITEDEYVYNYDYNDSVTTLPMAEFVPVTLVYGLTLVLGVVGNVLVIFAICRYRRMRSVTNIFLVSLSSADLLLVLICVPIKFAKWFTFTWIFGEFLCKTVHYMQNVSVICSVLTLTSMSIERYYAILHPMRAKYLCTVPRARRVIITVWIMAFILAVPIIFGRVQKEVGVVRTGYWCVKQWPNHIYEKTYEIGMLMLILVAPLVIMTYAYFSICRELWMVTSWRAAFMGNSTSTRGHQPSSRTTERPTTAYRRGKKTTDDVSTRKQVIKMLVAVIALFAICWGPSLIDDVLVAFGLLDRLHYGYLKHMRQAFALMSYFNSCVNPIVYAFMSKNFRETFRYALCSCGGKSVQRWRYSQQASLYTHSTSLTLTRSTSEYESHRIVASPGIRSVEYEQKTLVTPT